MVQQIYDIDLLGTIDSQGNIKELYDKEAVQNSILIWLTSYSTDIIRSPGKGGYLTSYLSKPMSESNRINIIDAITDGFNQDYNLVVILKTLTVTPNYEQKYWGINIEAYIPAIKDDVTISALINNLV